MIKRQPDWPTKVGLFFAQNAARPFEWGSWDCALMAADTMQEMTGHDFAAPLRGKYHTAAGAMALIKPEGDLIGLVTTLMGQPMDNPLMAQRGDLAVVNNEGRQAAGIVWGAGVVAAGQHGLVTVPNSSVLAIWRV